MYWKQWMLLIPILSMTIGYASPRSLEVEQNLQGTGVNMENKHVLISGAGIAGLSLAYFLKQYGFTVTIVEKHPGLRTGGYKVDIRGTALEVIKRMGIYPLIVEARTSIQGATIVDSTGRSITTMNADLCGGRVEGDLEIMRGRLCEILWEQLEGVECLFGDSITQISQDDEGVYVQFDKNKPRSFDLVVGADGLHSTVRRLAFGDESHFLQELGLYISVYSIPNFLHLDRWEIEYFQPQKFVNVYSTSGDVDAKAGFAFSSEGLQFDSINKSQQQLLEEAFEGAGWEVPRLLEAMKDTSDFYFDSIAQVHMPHWSEGRVVLVGDAAYAPSPLSGQGTSVAIVGSYALAGELALAAGDYKRAFAEYERYLGNFIKKNQELVRLNVALMGEKNSWLAWLSGHLMRILPESWIQFIKTLGTRRINEAANDLVLKNYPIS